jgi:hypothetical protein
MQMTGWDHEFAVRFINGGHFRVTDPGPLHAPALTSPYAAMKVRLSRGWSTLFFITMKRSVSAT